MASKRTYDISVVDYDPTWPCIFEQEKRIIEQALGDQLITIHHIGSTSVPGLLAKPKIDIIAASKERFNTIKALESVGYKHDGEWNIPLKCGFAKRDGVHVNLHMYFQADHPEIELNLSFRNYLRTHDEVRDEYAALKLRILEGEYAQSCVQVGALTFPNYTLQKRAFIDSILRRIDFSRFRVIKCLTHDEQLYADNAYYREFGKHIDFHDQRYEHFMLYKGVDLHGYAAVRTSPTYECILLTAQCAEGIKSLQRTTQEWLEINQTITQ